MCFSDHRTLLFQCNVNLKINKPNKQFTLHDFAKINERLLNIGQEPIDIDTFMLKFSDLIKNDSKFAEPANNPKTFWHNINSLIYNKNPNGSEIFAIKSQSSQLLNELLLLLILISPNCHKIQSGGIWLRQQIANYINKQLF